MHVLFSAEGSPLFSGGKTHWRIILDADADETLCHAGKELSMILGKVSGASFPIVRGPMDGKTNCMVVGTASSACLKGVRERLGLSGGTGDEISVRVLDGNLYLAGNRSRGALYAVYYFVQRALGVRFVFAGPGGEHYPPMDRYDLPVLCWHHVPSFAYRGFHLCYRHLDAAYETWMSRNFMNILRSEVWNAKEVLAERQKKGFHIIMGAGVHLPKELLKTHPECFALDHGQRHTRQLCLTNQLGEDLLIKQLEENIRRCPEMEIMNFGAADNQNYCRCAGCSARDHSTTWFDFYQRVCTRLHRTFPKLKFAAIAYQGYQEAPSTVLRNSEFIEFCQHDRCYAHELHHEQCPSNMKSLSRLAAWGKKGIPLGIWSYVFDVFAQENSIMIPFYPILADEIRVFRDLGITSVIPEVWRGFPVPEGGKRNLSQQNAFNTYLYAQMLWNADADPERLLTEWNRIVYGSAGPMADEIMRRSALWHRLSSKHLGGCHNSPFGFSERLLTPQRIGELDGLMTSGLLLLENETGDAGKRHLGNFRFLVSGISQWKQAYWMKTRGFATLAVPRVENQKKPFEHAARLPELKTLEKGKTLPDTEIRVAWEPAGLHVKAVCQENGEEKDGQDRLEVHLANVENADSMGRCVTVHRDGRAVNAVTGSRIEVRRDVQAKVWQIEMFLPFGDFGPRPVSGDIWRFGCRRVWGDVRSVITGAYPRDLTQDPQTYGTLLFSSLKAADKRLLFVLPQKKLSSTSGLRSSLFKYGWSVDFCASPEDLPKNLKSYDIIVICTPYRSFGYHHGLPTARLMKQALSDGQIVIVTSVEWLGVENFLGTKELKLLCSGYDLNSRRPNVDILDGPWWRKPHNLMRTLQNSMSPPFGYKGVDGKWKELASIELKNGKRFPWLNIRPYKKGLLVITSAGLGLSGGHVFLGAGQMDTVPRFFDNLLHNCGALQKP